MLIYSQEIAAGLERAHLEHQLSYEKARFQAAIESTSEGVLLTDLNRRITAFNPAAACLLRLKNSEPFPRNAVELRHTHDVFFPDGTPVGTNGPIAQALSGQAENEAEYTLQRIGTDESWPISLSYGPIRDTAGKIVGAVIVGRDMSLRKQRELKQRAYDEERLQAALDAAQMGTWEYDLLNEVVIGDARLSELFGFPHSAKARPASQFFAAVHVDDLNSMTAELQQRILERRQFQCEFRIVRPDGSTIWVKSTGNCHSDRNDQPSRMVGVVFDITDQKLRQCELRDREARFQALFQTAFLGILTVERQGRIEGANQAACEIFGQTEAALKTFNLLNLFTPPDATQQRDHLTRLLASSHDLKPFEREFTGYKATGEVVEVELTSEPISDTPLYAITIMEITRRKELEKDVVEIASEEQRRIGQDLHDTVAQELSAATLHVSNLLETLKAEGSNGAALCRSIAATLKRSQQSVRYILSGLIPVAVEREGLMSALADLAQRCQQQTDITVTFDCPELVSVANHQAATQLYQIAHEAVQNAVKHSGTDSIQIELIQIDDDLTLRVTDVGRGMDGPAPTCRGLGIRIMHSRAEIIGAKLSINSDSFCGTVVQCVLRQRNARAS